MIQQFHSLEKRQVGIVHFNFETAIGQTSAASLWKQQSDPPIFFVHHSFSQLVLGTQHFIQASKYLNN